MAAAQGRLKMLQKIWEWANEKFTTEEINKKLLLTTDDEGRNVFYMAAEQGELELLQKIWEWAKETLTIEETIINYYEPNIGKEEPSFIWQQIREDKEY
jgi:endo-1,4-beta-D-glucanase Y